LLPTPLDKEWLKGARSRLEIARQIRYSNPRQALDIFLTLFDELLRRLETQ
jgi:hypothetical protein